MRVAIVSTSRADFGHIVWPLKLMKMHDFVEPTLIVIGAHLSPEYGYTINEVLEQDVTVDHTIETLISSDSDVGMAKTIGVSILGLSDLLATLRPDFILITADRYEMLAVASVALALRIPIAHVEGGEISSGAIDDAVRNALTKISHLHFVPHVHAANRVMAMGEEHWRICVCGTPSLDHLIRRSRWSKTELEERIQLKLADQFVIVSFHPVTLAEDTVGEANALYHALEKLNKEKPDTQLVFCFPNCDTGSHILIERARKFCEEHAACHVFVNLDHWAYWNLLFFASVMIGNSSSALMEAPSIPLPVVNIGKRQEGRLMAKNVIDCGANSTDIFEACRKAMSAQFKQHIAAMQNPYGNGTASEKIRDFILRHQDKELLLHKAALPVTTVDNITGFVQPPT